MISSKAWFSTLCLSLFGSTILLAQGTPKDGVDLSGMLWYIIPFYLITFCTFGLFLQKLLKPSFPTKWLYLSAIIAIVGAMVVVFGFEQVQQEQLSHQTLRMMEESSNQNEQAANFWVIGLPNVFFLFMGIVLDFQQRKKA